MLTKDLLRYTVRKDRGYPQFIKDDKPEFLSLAADLMAYYQVEAKMCRSEIEEGTSVTINAFSNVKVAKGLNKLLLDRSEFSLAGGQDYVKTRKLLFEESARQLLEQHEDLDSYRTKVQQNLLDSASFFEAGIYSDLPENEVLTKFKETYSKELLERYNVSQVQSLLLYSCELNVTIVETDPAKLRKMFKYLKFFRLLAQIRRVGAKKKGTLELKVDGPLNLFESTQKYGLQLACFFPAILDMTKWQLKASIKIGQKRFHIEIDDKQKLKGFYKNFTAFIPEEILMFHKLFKEKSKDWQIVGEAPLLEAAGEIFFPDISFEFEGQKMYLELFHRWHFGALKKRLMILEEEGFENLIIGVDRALLKDVELKELLEGSEVFQERGFLFRDFPGVATVQKILKKSVKASKKK